MGQQLNLTTTECAAVETFMRTLTGADVYTDERWSDPFYADGTPVVIGGDVR